MLDDLGRKQKRRLLFVVVILVLIFAGIYQLFLAGTKADYTIKDSGLRYSHNFGSLRGDDIYYYNGLAFLKQNLETNQINTLNTGRNLPSIDKIFWADDNGVLFNFDGSFAATIVEQKLRSRNETVNKTTQNYTWYYDFKSGDLHLVDTAPIEKSLAVYSPSEKGFYYIAGFSDRIRYNPNVGITISFYDITTNTKSQISSNLQVTDPTHLVRCVDAVKSICLIARSQQNPQTKQLLQIKSGSSKELLQTKGLILKTNQASKFVFFEPENPASNGVLDEADILSGEGRVFDVGNDEKKSTGLLISGTGFGAYFENNRNLFIIDDYLRGGGVINTEELHYGIGKKSWWHPAKVATIRVESKQEAQITEVSSYGNRTALLVSYDDQQLLFSNKSQNTSVALGKDSVLSEQVSSCAKSQSATSDYFKSSNEFKVYLTLNQDFEQKVAAFSSCMKQTNTTGFNFDFVGRDPVNGRIVTD